MLTAKDALNRYGDPRRETNMILWDVPPVLEIGVIPKKIYCNKDLVKPLKTAFENIILCGADQYLISWDGCFNIRNKRGATSPSLHSWGLAIDINAGRNEFGKPPTMHRLLVECFVQAGFDWGGTWSKPDGQHFQLKSL